ncbi:MAG TPA: hypothetical protein VGD68_14940 [Streptosporangiaceae bacterium]
MIDPQGTVSLSDQSLCGYITKGQSTPLPAGMTVRYASGHPGVVCVRDHGSVLQATGPGPATITATVTYHGHTARGTLVVDVS